ncbi:hypothetical protein WA026_001369 [Henosepilachna vigintioctopunctata]|uniref:SWI/SNF-related matrix-associated actin-dependent regulator of chromatin subfamily A-like protein 1 n=1 Tax=Henosepilachna vigintioctopunctata TaxID=420089 RepID=A0AAW1UQ59_9CUCU
MQCSAEEIERKRQQALKKLASKNKSPLKVQKSDNNWCNTLPQAQSGQKFKFNQFNTNRNNKPYAKTPNNINKTPAQFYGKEQKITAKCVLLNEVKFGIELSAFSTPAVEVFKTIPSRNYNTTTKQWDFLVKDYATLMNKLEGLTTHLDLIKLPKFVIECVEFPQRDLSSIDLSKVESKLRNALMPFQKEGVAFGIDKCGRCLLADDMGLGKTFQALGIASHYRNDWPLLIVTTASMKNTWEETILQYLPSVPLMQLQYMVSTKDYINDAIVLIISHDMLTRAIDKLLERKFGVLIIDESHNFKNFKAKGTQAAIRIAKQVRRVILLSGTPALSRPSELYTQLSLIDSRFFGNFIEYSRRYCDGKTTNFGWDASGQSNLQELEIILAKKFMIRRTKDNVLAAMPNKSQEIVSLDVKLNQFSEEDKKCLTALANKYRDTKKSNEKHAILLTFFSETAKIKIPSVISYVLQVLDERKKFLLFAHHQIMLDSIAQILLKKGKEFIRIDGTTNSDQRKYFVDKFQGKDSCICALLSITAANAGITLTAAELVIFAELHWNPSILSQAESRAHRIGQEKPVTIRYLLAPGTADDSIWPMLQKKQKILNEVGLCKDNFNSVQVKNQTNCAEVKLTEGITYRTPCKTLDITTYFESPSKRQKLNDSVVSDLNESLLDDSINITQIIKENVEKSSEQNENCKKRNDNVQNEIDVDDMFNDDLDDYLSTIDI